jgi:hypothetical protein
MWRRGMHIAYLWERQKERDHWKEQEVGRLAIIKWILRDIKCYCVDWIDIAQDGDQWRGLVNTVLNLRVP